MNFKHVAIKTLCKCVLLDHRAQPRFVEFDTTRHEVLEAPIDLYRLTNGEHRFAIVFQVDDVTLRFTLIFGAKSSIDRFEGFVKGDCVDSVSIAYPKDFNGIDAIWVENVIDEIMCHTESTF